jgi:hypothetical protein
VEDLIEARDAPGIASTRSLYEASLAPREGERLSLPFDQYSRMRIAENVVRTLYGEIAGKEAATGSEFRLRVLDVGGYPGVLRHFLASEAYDLSVVDVVPDDGTIPGYTQGSGLDLPYEDGSFDVVTSLDTLEHIPDANRPRFLAEVQRVACHAVLLINPVQSLEADLAEETLDEYIRWILDAQQEQLAEHRQFGLPDFAGTMTTFEGAGWKTLAFPTANIHNWLFMMVAKHYLISLRDERANAFERTLDRFYNLAFQESDRAQPSYRGVLVAVRPGLEAALRTLGDMYPPVAATPQSSTERLQLAQLLMSLIDLKVANHEDRKLREQMEHRDRHVAGLESKIDLLEEQKRDLQNKMDVLQHDAEAEFEKHKAYIARLEEDQHNKDEHILYLEKLLQGIESGRVMRLTRSLARFLGRN